MMVVDDIIASTTISIGNVADETKAWIKNNAGWIFGGLVIYFTFIAVRSKLERL